MIRDQCRAYCQCSYCTERPQNGATNGAPALRITKANLNGTAPSKDELYLKSLTAATRNRAMMESAKNASRFIPDEQLLSSQKRREAKDAADMSELVPLRRRDRLEELLLLEGKARLREEARLRAERRALGLPEDEEAEELERQRAAEEAEAAEAAARALEVASQASGQRRLSSGRATPASRCSADRDLDSTIHAIKGILDQQPGKPDEPLSHAQVYQLRKLVHEQDKQTRQMMAEEDQPTLCNHCFQVNVQARHLLPQMSGSVAFAQTGKIINPEDKVKFGTDSQRGFDGTYSAQQVDVAALSTKGRLTNYNPHPHGTGVVFLPVQSASQKQQGLGASRTAGRSAYETTFNNNIAPDVMVEEDLQYPGSTYNVYDGRFADSSRRTPQAASAAAPADAAPATGANVNAAQTKAVSPAAAAAPSFDQYKSSSAMWRTSNQAREAEMARFMEFQKTMDANSKKVYSSTTTRNPKDAALSASA